MASTFTIDTLRRFTGAFFDINPRTFVNMSMVDAGDLTIGLTKCVAYGAANTAARFIANVGEELPLTRLDAQQDLDTVDDLVKLQRHPPVKPTAAQKRFWRQIPQWLA